MDNLPASVVIKKDSKKFLILFSKRVAISFFSILAIFWLYCLAFFVLIRFAPLSAWGLGLVRGMMRPKVLFGAYQLVFAKPLGALLSPSGREVLRLPYPRRAYLVREQNSEGGFKYGIYGLIEKIIPEQTFDPANPSCTVSVRSGDGLARNYRLEDPARVFVPDSDPGKLGDLVTMHEVNVADYCNLETGRYAAITFYSFKDYKTYTGEKKDITEADLVLVLVVLPEKR